MAIAPDPVLNFKLNSGSVALNYFHKNSELNIRFEIRPVTMGVKPLWQIFSSPPRKLLDVV